MGSLGRGEVDERLTKGWERLEREADQRALKSLGPESLHPRLLDPGVRRLSDRYTVDRADSLRQLDDGKDSAARAARLGYFLLADAPKMVTPLTELAWAGQLPSQPRVLDVGCGIGAMSLGAAAVYEAMGAPPFSSVTLLDRDPWALEQAVALHHAAFGQVAEASRLDLTRGVLPMGPFDLVVLGLVLNELSTTEQRVRLLSTAVARLAPGGVVIVVEPALRECARELQSCRDALLATGRVRLFAPCTHEGPCPLLARERDWCHEERDWTPPPRLAERIARVGLRRGALLFSYLTLQSAMASQSAVASKAATAPRDSTEPFQATTSPSSVPPWRASPTLRVVSGMLSSKGKTERLLCGLGLGPTGLLRATRLDRHASETNGAFGDLQRGDFVRMAPVAERIGVEGVVERLSPELSAQPTDGAAAE